MISQTEAQQNIPNRMKNLYFTKTNNTPVLSITVIILETQWCTQIELPTTKKSQIRDLIWDLKQIKKMYVFIMNQMNE